MSKSVKILLNRHFALIIALMIGALAGMLLLFMPEWRFAGLVHFLGIDQMIPAAQPPFGGQARKLAALAAGIFGVLGSWPLVRIAERALGGKSGRKAKTRRAVTIPTAPKVSAADAHPDAPPRRPIFAETELGAPLMSEEALASDGELVLGARDEALVLDDLDFSPLPERVAAPMPPVPETVQQAAPEPVPPVVASAAPVETVPVAAEADVHSIDSLINRLDVALRGRSVRHAANPAAAAALPGDIGSLRQALRSFSGSH
jgi:hypothetical protein